MTQTKQPPANPARFNIASPFAIGRVCDEVAIKNVWRNAEVVIAVGRNLVFAGANGTDPIDLHQSANPPFADIKARLLQLHGHARTAMASQAEAILLADMRLHFDVPALPSARRAQAPESVATGTDPHHPADRLHPPLVPPAVNKREPRGRQLAKNWVAFFRISLSSLSTRFSRRSRSFSRARSACGAATRSAGRNSDTHLPSVDRPIPKSDATRRRDSHCSAQSAPPPA